MPRLISQYRRRLDANIWHFCRNCLFWPATHFEDRGSVPPQGILCQHCKQMRANEQCEC